MVLRAFRCQRHGHEREREILTSMCEELFYQGRYVWLRGCREVRLMGATSRGPNRIRYRLISTVTYKCLPLKQKENYRIELTPERAVAAMPVIKNRRQTLFLFMDPEWLIAHHWDTAESGKLIPVELAFLLGKPQPPDLERTVRSMCMFRQLIDGHGVLTKDGRRILSAYQVT